MKYVIVGGNKVHGEVRIQGAKNSVLALIAGSILSSGSVYIQNCPKIYDVEIMLKIIKKLGGKAVFQGSGVYIDTNGLRSTSLPAKLTKEVRASLFLTGALLARHGEAQFSRPGGCNIGSRPMDIHIDALRKMGAIYSEQNSVMKFSATKLNGAVIRLKYPSVGATENVMMASSLASGVTVIENPAKEPEIIDLQNFINSMGGKIVGAGTNVIRIEGVKKLGGTVWSPIPDRIEAGTFLLTTACCGGELLLKGVKPQNISSLTEKLVNNACNIRLNNDNIYIKVNNKLLGFGEIVTSPYPGFPTDLQPLLVACACGTNGKTFVKETVFESRYKYAEELIKMGANIHLNGDVLEVCGSELKGAKVYSPDLRGGASLCLAGLMAEGKTIVENVEVIERGYENFDKKLSKIGMNIVKK